MSKSGFIRPPLLQPGDEVRVVAPSRSLGGLLKSGKVSEIDVEFAIARLRSLGITVSFGSGVWEANDYLQAPISRRLEDFHDAFSNSKVKALLSVQGGIGAIHLLNKLDYKLIKMNPKAFCGYSDNCFIQNALLSSSGLISFYGPNFASFMMKENFEYSLEHFKTCLFSKSPFSIKPSKLWSDDDWVSNQGDRKLIENRGYWVINPGEARGQVVGGNLGCLNLLQGTQYFPDISNGVLFLENPGEGRVTLNSLESSMKGLIYQSNFSNIKGLVLGRYPESAKINRNNLTMLLETCPELKRIPVVGNVDFGHTTPTITFPIGGGCSIKAFEEKIEIIVNEST